MTHGRLGRGPGESCILFEDIVGSWTEEDEDVDDPAL